jgi:hypothetical protein
MTLRFDPPKDAGRYALYLEGASGKNGFRTYSELGHAKNAYHFRGHRRAAKILENVDGKWYVLFDIRQGTLDLPWFKETIGWYNRERKVAKPMTRDEYAEWRLAVERESKSTHVRSE